MVERFTVQIDLNLLRQNLSCCDAQIWSDGEVERWLSRMGFEPMTSDAWRCSEDTLYVLTPEEILNVDPKHPFLSS